MHESFNDDYISHFHWQEAFPLKAPVVSMVPCFSPDLVHFQPEESPLLFGHSSNFLTLGSTLTIPSFSFVICSVCFLYTTFLGTGSRTLDSHFFPFEYINDVIAFSSGFNFFSDKNSAVMLIFVPLHVNFFGYF